MLLVHTICKVLTDNKHRFLKSFYYFFIRIACQFFFWLTEPLCNGHVHEWGPIHLLHPKCGLISDCKPKRKKAMQVNEIEGEGRAEVKYSSNWVERIRMSKSCAGQLQLYPWMRLMTTICAGQLQLQLGRTRVSCTGQLKLCVFRRRVRASCAGQLLLYLGRRRVRKCCACQLQLYLRRRGDEDLWRSTRAEPGV